MLAASGGRSLKGWGLLQKGAAPLPAAAKERQECDDEADAAVCVLVVRGTARRKRGAIKRIH